MALSKKTLETLIDLVENKLGCMEVFDREDARELARLEKARRELGEFRTAGASPGGEVVSMVRAAG